jgi:hypothetical protein
VKIRHRFGSRHPGRQWVILALLALSFLTGCASTNQDPYLYKGAGLGAAMGAGLGAAINHRNPWKGAAIGGLLGTAAGGLAGEAYGRSNTYPYESQPQGYYPPQGYQPQGYYQPQPYYGPPPG